MDVESNWSIYGNSDDGDPSEVSLGSVGVLVLRKLLEDDPADPAPSLLLFLLVSGST